MACIAAGKKTGVAPNADLFLAKSKGNFDFEERDGQGQTVRSEARAFVMQPPALRNILDTIRDHIEQRLKSDPDAKSVINMSWGMSDINPRCFN